MRKIVGLLIAAVMLFGVFTGCQPVPDDGTDGTTTVPETTDTIPSCDIGSFSSALEHLFPFIYDGEAPSIWWVSDPEKCVIGALYVTHKGETGNTVQISDEEILLYVTCEDHILYVTKAAPRKVIRSDYTGSSQTVIYEASNGDIAELMCYDKAGQAGQLVTLEGNTHVVLTDIASAKTEVLMVQDNIIEIDPSLYGSQGLIWFRKADNSPWFYNTRTGELLADSTL